MVSLFFSDIFIGDMDAPQRVYFHDYPDEDVDKFIIKGMSIGQIRNLCGHVCDLCNRNPNLRESTFHDKLCIRSAPVAVYIPLHAKAVFVRALVEHFSQSHQFVAPSDQPNRLPVHCQCTAAFTTSATFCAL